MAVQQLAKKTLLSLGSTGYIEIGRQVLRREAQGIQQLAASLDNRFSECVELIQRTKGHVILTGMGKSGHIAHKIAATLASTGTASFFVHPAEANHGDLGMIVPGDTVIALSESGESEELSGIIHYTRRQQIPLIAMTRNAHSTLGQASDAQLLIPNAEPACPLRLAPTTSTTMMLALGDALAITLLELHGFSAEDFKTFHPGGQLGRQLVRVDEIMHTDALPTVSPTTSIEDVINEINDKKFGCTAVVDDTGTLAGIITDGDLRRHLGPDILNNTAAEIMTKSPRTTTATTLAVSALATMNDKSITVLFVLDDDDKPIGILHLHDCLRAGLR